MRSVVRDLERLRRTGRLLLVGQRAALVLAGIGGAILLLVLLDYVFRFPGPLRLAILVGGLAALAWALWSSLGPALRFKPDLTALALRVERAVPALQGRLASSVEFAGAGLDATNPLAARVVEETQRRADGALAGMLQPRRTLAAVGVLGAALVVCGGAAAMAPETARVGLARLLTPLADNPWPSRTRVESAVAEGPRPRGPAFPLRARVTLGDPETRVTALYRMEEKGEAGPWRSAVLTAQGGDDPALAGIHERLIESDADAIEFSFATFDFESPVQRVEFIAPPAVRRASLVAQPPAHAAHRPEVQVELGDGTDARGTSAPALLEGSQARIELELTKPVSVPGAIDDAWLAATLGLRGPAGEGAGARRSAVPALRVDPADPTRWTISWRADAPLDLALRLEDEHGIGNLTDIVYRVGVVADALPSASILEPQVDETVAPGAAVAVVAEGRDDIGVMGLVVEIERQRGDRRESLTPFEAEPVDTAQPPTAVGLDAVLDLAALEAIPGDIYVLQAVAVDGYELDGVRHEAARSTRRTLRVVTESDLGEQLRRQLAALRQSAMRIDAQQAEVAAEVAAALEAARGGEETATSGRPRKASAGAEADRRQAQVGERLDDQRTALEAVAGRLQRNRVDDPELAATLELARDHLDRAGDASGEAAEALRRAQAAERQRGDGAGQSGGEGRPQEGGEQRREGQPSASQAGSGQPGDRQAGDRQSGDGQPSSAQQGGRQPADDRAGDRPPEAGKADDARAEAQQAQAEVRDELAELIELLNRDADAWSLTRQVEKLAEQVRQLERDTGRLGQRTVGRERSELPSAEQTELERIAGAQRDAADQARELTESLDERAQRQETQPDSDSGVLRQAARTAEEENLAEQLEEAGRQVESNRMQNAQASQAAARRTLERMLQDLREGRRAQSRELQRQLASLVESIMRLEKLQEDEIAALAAAPRAAAGEDGEQEALEQRSRSMIRLNQNTDGVIDDARRAGRGAERIARVLGSASDEQGSAVGALRARPAQREQAATHEESALTHLREARTLAEQARQRAEEEEAEERREALLRRYRDAQDMQRGLLEEVQDLARAGNQGRRALLESKRLGGMQQKLRESIAGIRDESEDVSRSLVFTKAHESIDAASRGAESRLAEGDTGPRTTAAQASIIESLGAMITALEEDAPEEEPFEEQQAAGEEGGEGGQQGGQGAPPVIPPRAEIKLLRSLQEQLLRQTRMLDEAALEGEALGEAARELGKRQRELADLAQQMLEALGEGAEPPEPAPRDPM